MEDQCHQLDMAIVGEKEKGGPTYSNFMDDFAEPSKMS